MGTITMLGWQGGAGGQGGDGGNAGAAGLIGGAGTASRGKDTVGGTALDGGERGDISGEADPSLGGQGGTGGDGGNGADANGAFFTVGNVSDPVVRTVVVAGPVRLTAGTGGTGGAGGTRGNAVLSTLGNVSGGAGGVGGIGGTGGGQRIEFMSPTVIFNDVISVRAGDGGQGGYGGQQGDSNSQNLSGDGGQGGAGGSSTFIANRDIVLNLTQNVYVISGSRGVKGDNNFSATATGEQGGTGGNSEFTVKNDVFVRNETSINVIKGTDAVAGTGNINITIGRNLAIDPGKLVTLDFTSSENLVWNGLSEDTVIINTLLLKPGSSFRTSGDVFTDTTVGPPTGSSKYYQVDNLDIVTDATWATAGTYMPDTSDGNYMRFNMANISPSATMVHIVDVAGNGQAVSLTNFSPMAQHEAFLANQDRPVFADDPANWDFDWTHGVSNFFTTPAFIMSPYQTKRLHLGNVVLLDNIDYASLSGLPATIAVTDGNRTHYVSDNSALGPLYDDFAYTAGLRRYYWDVYTQDNSGSGDPDQLIAFNNYTADASYIYAQAATASSVAVNQTFQVSLAVMDNALRAGLVDHYHIEAAFSGSHVRTETGSHVDVDNWSGALALSRKSDHSLGETVFGIFGEFGTGGYDTFASVPRYGDLFGDGDVRTYGGGIFMKTIFTSRTILEASVRGGGFRNEFRLKGDPWVQHPEMHNADTGGTYLGGHVGVTQQFELRDSSLLETYGKYFVTRTNSDSFRTSFGDEISIADSTSSKIRVGGRWTEDISAEKIQFYFGLAFEHEFDGKVTGKNGPDPFLHTVNPTGTSGFGELGLNFNPMENLSVTVGAFGWAGQQKGGGGNAAINFSF
jgi:hypothetical protein